MQNSIKATVASAVITLLLSGNIQAQDANSSSTAKTVYKNIPTVIKDIPANVANENIAANNPMILAKFSTLFPLATQPQWTGSKDNLWVSFLNNGRKASACFTPKGQMNYAISDCAEDQLPAAFSNTIKKDYPLYHLYNAVEIKAYDAVAYQVVLENSNKFITLKYTSEGVEEIQQVVKTAN